MKDLIIIGAGGFGKEALVIAQEMNKNNPQWNILGFLDDTKPINTEIFRGFRTIGTIKDWEPSNNQYFSIGISNPQAKETIYNLFKNKGAQFATLVLPTAFIPTETILGECCLIGHAWFGVDVILGNCVTVMSSMIDEATIGDFATTTGFSNIAGAILGKRVFVGSQAVILNGKTIGDDAKIGAGSIVIRNVKPGTTVFGNPAKEI